MSTMADAPRLPSPPGSTRGSPRYARATAAAAQRDYANRSVENIGAQFRPNSHRSLRDARRDASPFKPCGSTVSVLPPLVYQHSSYEAVRDARNADKRQHEATVQRIHGVSQFKLSPRSPGTPRDRDGRVIWQREADPYDTLREATRQHQLESQRGRLAGPFRPTGTERVLRHATRARLDELMSDLCKSLMELADDPNFNPTGAVDGDGTPRVVSPHRLSESMNSNGSPRGPRNPYNLPKPMVLSTSQDIIAVRFAVASVAQEEQVTAFMNYALRKDTVVLEAELVKVPGAWGIEAENGHAILFMLRPPWVHLPPAPTRIESPEQVLKGSRGSRIRSPLSPRH